MRKTRFSADKAQLLKIRYERGATLRQLSEEFRVAAATVAAAIREYGGVIRSRGRRLGSVKYSKGSQLLEKLDTFSNLVDGDYPNQDTIKCVIDYALRHNDGRTFRKIDRRYNYNGAFSQFRREHLENSYYIMGRLWRAVYQQVLREEENLSNVKASDFSVTEDDLKFCMEFLSREDRDKILSWLAQNKDYMVFPNEEGVQKIVNDCEKTMRSIVSSKLRFVYKYDPAYEAEDLVNYLRIIAYRVASKYDWEKLDGEFAYLKCKNYTKRSLWNAAFLIIKENTGEDYSRLSNVGSGEREYQTTTISIDSGGDEEGCPSLEETLGEEADTSFEIIDLVSQVEDPKLLTYLKLEHEEVTEFTNFVKKVTGRNENDLYVENYNKWRELARRFSGLPARGTLHDNSVEALRSLGM